MINSLRPKLGSQRTKCGRILLVCYFDPNGIPTIYENISFWQAFSRYGIEILNLWPNRGGTLTLPKAVDLSEFDGIVIHCTASYSVQNLYSLDRELTRPFEQFDGLKVLMKQDEQVHTNSFSRYIADKKLDLVISCVPPDEREKVYPRSVVGDVAFLHAFTGYVSPYLRELLHTGARNRGTDISYRGSIQPLEFGRLGFEKRKIGHDVELAAGQHSNLKTDISSRWEDRIGGQAWFEFLGRSKAVLGVESGSNLFDFAGEVATWCRLFEAKHPACSRVSESFYLKAHNEYLWQFEGNVNYAQVSPRHFEAAAARSAQILYEGHYSGIFLPNLHFFSLKRDLSNFTEAVDFVRDEKKLLEFTERTYEEIILNRQYSYEQFVESFDHAIEAAFDRKARLPGRIHRRQVTTRRRALVLAAHDPAIDPRIEWMSEGLAKEYDVCELGTSRVRGDKPSWQQLSKRRMRVRVDPSRHDWEWVLSTADLESKAPICLQVLNMLFAVAEMPLRPLVRTIGALDHVDADLSRFRWYCRHFVDCNGALIQAARLIGQFDVIVASDLNTLPAALVLGKDSNATVIYDSHEYWPFADVRARHWEVNFWQEIERALAPRAQIRVTVSPHLADCMSKEYDCDFLAVPNCAPLDSALGSSEFEAALGSLGEREEMRFLFLGSFAIDRGLEGLVKAWDGLDPRAKLVCRGPDNAHKKKIIELARSRGLLNKTVFFPEAVSESELVRAAREADVGLIPYKTHNIVYRFCCPNKLSQYMAAGLPILCNKNLSYVSSVVTAGGIGKAFDFDDPAALAEVVGECLSSRQEIIAMSRRSREVFLSTFNWETVSDRMYHDLSRIAETIVRPRPRLDFTWIDQGREMAGDNHRRHVDELLDAHKTRIADYKKKVEKYKEKIDKYRASAKKSGVYRERVANYKARIDSYKQELSKYGKSIARAGKTRASALGGISAWQHAVPQLSIKLTSYTRNVLRLFRKHG